MWNGFLSRYALVDFGLAQQAPGSIKKTAPCGTPMSRSLAKTETSTKVSNCSVKASDGAKVKTFAALSPKSKTRRSKTADVQVRCGMHKDVLLFSWKYNSYNKSVSFGNYGNYRVIARLLKKTKKSLVLTEIKCSI